MRKGILLTLCWLLIVGEANAVQVKQAVNNATVTAKIVCHEALRSLLSEIKFHNQIN